MSRFSDCVLSIYDSSTDDQTKDAVSPPICVMPMFIITDTRIRLSPMPIFSKVVTDILLILGLLRL